MIYTPEMMRTLARQHDEESDTRAALMQAADTINYLYGELGLILREACEQETTDPLYTIEVLANNALGGE